MENEAPGFCTVPWVQLSTKPNGNFRVCCLMNTAKLAKQGLLTDGQGKPLNAGTSNMDLAVNSPEVRDIRRRMLAGEKPVECATCWQKEQLGLPSKRTVTNRSYAGEFTLKEAREHTKADGTTDIQPSYFDLRFGNLCNLRCVMCHPASSSQWYEDFRQIWQTDHFYDSGRKVALTGPSSGYDWHENEEFWRGLEARVPLIRQIYLVGGEPMLIDRHFEFLGLCVNRGVSGKIVLEYDTNLTRITERALSLWKHFKKVILRVSIDDFGAQNDYIRFPSKWKVIEANLAKVRDKELPLELSVTTTWQVLNCFTVTRLWEELGFVTSTRILNTPLYMDVGILPWPVKQAVIANFQRFMDTKAAKGWEKVQSYITHLEKTKDGYNPEYVTQLKDFLNRLDNLRGTNYVETFPEIASYLSWSGEAKKKSSIINVATSK